MPLPRDYDPVLQQFKQPPQEPDMNRLTFLRFLIENDLLDDGDIVGAACGPLAALAPKTEPTHDMTGYD